MFTVSACVSLAGFLIFLWVLSQRNAPSSTAIVSYGMIALLILSLFLMAFGAVTAFILFILQSCGLI